MATPIFTCGLECGRLNAHLQSSGTSESITTSSPLSGARSLQINTAGTSSYAAAGMALGAGLLVQRVRAKFITLPNGNTRLITAGGAGAGGNTGAYFKQSDGKIYAGSDFTVLGATGVSVTTGVEYIIDVKTDLTNNPWTIDVQVNGSPCGQHTVGSAADTTGRFPTWSVSSGVTANVYYDDILISATSGDYPLGPGYVNHFVPTSDGTHNIAGTGDFQRTLTGTDILNATTTAYQLVDDVPLETGASVDWINMLAPPNATDYVECKFGPAPGIITPLVPPRAVEVIAGIHQAATTTGNMEIRLNDNGTMGTVYTATGVAGVTSVAYKRAHFSDPPSAASVWIVGGNGNGDFNNLKVRFGSPAALDVVPDQYFDCIMIEAEFPATLGPEAYGRPSGQIGQNQFRQLLAT